MRTHMQKTTSKNGKIPHRKYNLSNDYKQIKEALHGATEDIKGRFGEIIFDSLQSVKEKSVVAQDSILTYVKEQPLKAIGIAALSGFLFARFMSRK